MLLLFILSHARSTIVHGASLADPSVFLQGRVLHVAASDSVVGILSGLRFRGVSDSDSPNVGPLGLRSLGALFLRGYVYVRLDIRRRGLVIA